MKELRLNYQSSGTTNIEFHLSEQSQVELFLHNIGRNRTVRLAKLVMHKGMQSIKIQSEKLQVGIYVYVLKANQQQMDFGRIVVN